jgi:phenylpropionate dioxygenase-like ring-hydroxylating dioxygenase large terminal subunit
MDGNEATPTARNYPLNCWWVAAFVDEVDSQPLARWLLDTPVVLFRTDDGELAALEDRCPHRQAPLSSGKVCGNAIQCGYHGFEFAADGRCVKVPSMARPAPLRVESYPVREIGPLVWIYLGDRAQIESVPPPPEFSWMTHPSFGTRMGVMEIAANYLLLKENVLDLTHLSYVHGDSFKIMDWTDPPQVIQDGETVAYRQEFIRSPLAPGYAHSIGLAPGTPWNRVGTGKFLSPGAHESSTELFDPERPAASSGKTCFAHLTTPIDSDHMLYFYAVGRNHAAGPEEMDKFAAILLKGFDEDKTILEQVQALARRTPRRGGQSERSVKADAAGIVARRIVKNWMDRETIA